MKHAETILAFGDSHARGYGAPARRGWLQRLREDYLGVNAANRQADFHDLTVAGEHAGAFVLRAAFAAVPQALLHVEGRRTVSIVSLGFMEVFTNMRAGRNPNDTTKFVSEFTQGVQFLLGLGDIVYVGVPPPDTLRLARGEESAAQESRTALVAIESLAAIITAQEAARAGRRYGIVQTYELLERDENFECAPDGTHPNAQGHAVIYELARPVFNNLVGGGTK
jgi:lysophospholipase L1-like esterase